MYIGVDIGGSNIAAGAFDDEFKFIANGKFSVTADMSAAEIVSRLEQLIRQISSDAGGGVSAIKGIGVGVPGTIEKDGVIVFTSNMPFRNTPVADMLSSSLNAPVRLENDANCAALGEFYAQGRDISDVILVTLGTGIGGGIIINRKLYTGRNSAAGEIGHMVIHHGGRECGCGRLGCWESYASATGLITLTAERMERDKGTLMWMLCNSDINKVSARTAFGAAKAGDAAASEVVREYLDYLSCGLINLVNIFEPEIIFLGGGLSNEDDEWLLNPLTDLVRRGTYEHAPPHTVISKATLGNSAGIIGAARLCTLKE